MDDLANIIFSDSLEGIHGSDNYVAHALCLQGSCSFVFNTGDYEMHPGDLIIVRRGKSMSKIEPSADFKAKVIYVEAKFLRVCTPQNNYDVKGSISLFLNPLMRLTAEQQEQCMADMNEVERRWNAPHHFHRDIMITCVQAMFLDFYEFHVQLFGEDKDVSVQNATIMTRFMQMLENGDFVKNREVTYYADVLCVTPKYLSEVSKKVSGQSANYWINRYTTLEISRLLRDKSRSLVDISEQFEFSSPAYFSRYVQNNLGMSPSEYRE